MKQIIKEIKNALKDRPGVKIQIELPRSVHARLRELAARDGARNNENVYIRDKLLEAIMDGTDHLEHQERELENRLIT